MMRTPAGLLRPMRASMLVLLCSALLLTGQTSPSAAAPSPRPAAKGTSRLVRLVIYGQVPPHVAFSVVRTVHWHGHPYRGSTRPRDIHQEHVYCGDLSARTAPCRGDGHVYWWSSVMGEPLSPYSESYVWVMRSETPAGQHVHVLDRATSPRLGTDVLFAYRFPGGHVSGPVPYTIAPLQAPTALGPARVEIHAAGVVMTLAVSRNAYLRNALLPVTIRIRNISNRPVDLSPTRCWATVPNDNPSAEVMRADGWMAYPPVFDTYFYDPTCLPPPAVRLLPQRVFSVTRYVILRTDRLRVRAVIDQHTVWTPFLRLRLSSGHAPRVSVRGASGPVAHVVSPRPRMRGPMLVMQACESTHGTRQSGDWAPVAGRTVIPSCRAPQYWEAAMGWPYYPVAYVNWTPRGGAKGS